MFFVDVCFCFFFFFQAEDGIRDLTVTGVQTCALPILHGQSYHIEVIAVDSLDECTCAPLDTVCARLVERLARGNIGKIGRASCRERVEISVVGGTLKKKKKKQIKQTWSK